MIPLLSDLSPSWLLWLGLIGLLACGEANDATASEEEAARTTETTATVPDTKPRILIFGNSLTAGYGLDRVEEAFPGLIQQRIDSMELGYQILNAGVSGETTTGGKNRLPWLLRQPIDILVIELGANDGLRGIDPAESQQNLAQMIDMARDSFPEIQIILCGMMAPPNMGQDYTTRFQAMYPALMQSHQVALVPFLLEGVAGEPELNQRDGIHPTPEGHHFLADNLWAILGPMLTGDA